MHRQSCTHRTLGIVPVRNGRTEECHDVVTDVLVDGAAKLHDQTIHHLEEPLEKVVGLFRIQAAAHCGIAGKIDEHDCDRTAICPLGHWRRRFGSGLRRNRLTDWATRQALATAPAEAFAAFILKAARVANQG